MNDSGDPLNGDRLAATLAALFREQGQTQLADLLSSAIGRVELSGHGGWNDEVAFYTLFLEVPVERYAAIEPRLQKVEDAIHGKASKAARVPGTELAGVQLIPVLSATVTEALAGGPGEGDHLWTPRRVRLFMSHVSAHKVAVARLKRNLDAVGVSAFVAHEDIEPSLEWQGEILKAIRSMHAQVALLTPDFHESRWTDQEVGMAIGRRVLVIPVNLGLQAYGFMATNQALKGDLADAPRLAVDLAKALARNEATRSLMAEALVVALEESRTYVATRAVTEVIEIAPAFSEDQLTRLDAATRENPNVSKAYWIPGRIQAVVERHRGT